MISKFGVEFYTCEDLMKELGVSRSRISQLIKDKNLPVTKIGRKDLFRKESIQQWLTERELRG